MLLNGDGDGGGDGDRVQQAVNGMKGVSVAMPAPNCSRGGSPIISYCVS